MKTFLRLSLICCVGMSCGTTQKTTASMAMSKNAPGKCDYEWAKFGGQPMLRFYKSVVNKDSLPPLVALPVQYDAYEVSVDQLQRYFSFVRDSSSVTNHAGAVLPLPLGCFSFDVYPANTVSTGIQQRSPNNIALKGTGIDYKGADLRLEWNGRQMTGQILDNMGKTWLITPVANGTRTIYLFYDKDNAGAMNAAPAEQRRGLRREEIRQDR